MADVVLPIDQVETFVAETQRLIEAVNFDEGASGGLLSRDTLRVAGELRQRLALIADLIANQPAPTT